MKLLGDSFISYQPIYILVDDYVFSSAESFVAFVNRKLCNRFSECWIPDFAGENNLAGKLSHPEILPKRTFYLGPLSRLKKKEDVLISNSVNDKASFIGKIFSPFNCVVNTVRMH